MKKAWGAKDKRDAALFVARRYARFEHMASARKWGIVELWIRRAQKHMAPTDRQIRNLIQLGAGRLLEKLQLGGGREL